MQRPDFYVKGVTPCTAAPELFVPDTVTSDVAKETRDAKKICADCPYRLECFAWALHNNEVGVWGGTSDRDRMRLRRQAIRRPQLTTV